MLACRARVEASDVDGSLPRRLARERESTSTRAQLGSLKPIEESGDEGPTQWRVRQVYGDGKELLDQLREVADLLAEGFNKSGSTSRDLLNGLVQKVR